MSDSKSAPQITLESITTHKKIVLTRATLGYSAERAPLAGGIFCHPAPSPPPLSNTRTNRRSEAGEATIESPEREDSNTY